MDISQKQALFRLRQHLPALIGCFERAWQTAQDVQRRQLKGHHPGTMASLLSSAFEDEVRASLYALPGVNLLSSGRRFMLFAKGLLVRLKKVDHEYHTKNYPTRTSERYDHQVPLVDIPEAPRLTLGYRLNEFGTAVSDLALIFSKGRSVQWVQSLGGNATVVQLTLDTNNKKTAVRTNRVKLKKPAPESGSGSEES